MKPELVKNPETIIRLASDGELAEIFTTDTNTMAVFDNFTDNKEAYVKETITLGNSIIAKKYLMPKEFVIKSMEGAKHDTI